MDCLIWTSPGAFVSCQLMTLHTLSTPSDMLIGGTVCCSSWLNADWGVQSDAECLLLPIHVCRFAVAIAHMFAGPFTGCGINPARVLGTSVYGNLRDMNLGHFSRGPQRHIPATPLYPADKMTTGTKIQPHNTPGQGGGGGGGGEGSPALTRCRGVCHLRGGAHAYHTLSVCLSHANKVHATPTPTYDIYDQFASSGGRAKPFGKETPASTFGRHHFGILWAHLSVSLSPALGTISRSCTLRAVCSAWCPCQSDADCNPMLCPIRFCRIYFAGERTNPGSFVAIPAEGRGG